MKVVRQLIALAAGAFVGTLIADEFAPDSFWGFWLPVLGMAIALALKESCEEAAARRKAAAHDRLRSRSGE